jgi:hypothetical protein
MKTSSTYEDFSCISMDIP